MIFIKLKGFFFIHNSTNQSNIDVIEKIVINANIQKKEPRNTLETKEPRETVEIFSSRIYVGDESKFSIYVDLVQC